MAVLQAPTIGARPLTFSPYDKPRTGWMGAAFLFFTAVLMQVVLQAQSIGQALRTHVLGWEPAALLGGRVFLLSYYALLLVLLVAAVRAYPRERRTSWRADSPISFWTFIGGIALLAFQVASRAAGMPFADPHVAEGVTFFGRTIEPVLLRLDLDLFTLIAMLVGFVGLHVQQDLPSGERLREIQEAEARQQDVLALRFLARAERMYGSPDVTRSMLEQAVETAREAGNDRLVAEALRDLAAFEHAEARWEQALYAYGQMMRAQWRHTTDGLELAVISPGITTADRWRASLDELVHPDEIAQCMRELGREAIALGDRVRGATLFGVADTLVEASGKAMSVSQMAERERAIDLGCTGLDDGDFWDGWTRGRAMTPTEAIAFAAGDRALAV